MKEIEANCAPDKFDEFMADVVANNESWHVSKLDEHYLTRGGQEWAEAPWRLGSGCQMSGTGVIELNPDWITDDKIKEQVPFYCIPSTIMWARDKTGQAARDAVPRGERVSGLTFILNHSKFVDRARALGVIFRAHAVGLQGEEASIEDVKAIDCGAWGVESFPFSISGALNGYDQFALSTAPDFEFDENGVQSYIRNVVVDGYVAANSNAQVSHTMIVGAMCPASIQENPWQPQGPWRQIYRRNPYIDNFEGWVRDDVTAQVNQCQAATIYQCKGGEVRNSKTHGYQAGVYGDYYSTFDLKVHHNDFEALRGVAQLLSPDSSGTDQYLQYSSYGLIVQSNTIRMLPLILNDWSGGVIAWDLKGLGGGIHDVEVGDNDFYMVGAMGPNNMAIRARNIDGLTISANNRFHDIPDARRWEIRDCQRVVLPPSSKSGCL